MKTIGVLGSGSMGAGIIQLFAQSGYNVVFRSRKQDSIDKGLMVIQKNLGRLVEKGNISDDEKKETMNRIYGATDINIIARADLVVEAALEDMEAKKSLFNELDKICKKDSIFATNTSSLSITEIATATNRPEKIIGMHFFNPVGVMKLVEIVKGLTTSEETLNAINELTQKVGKVPVIVNEAPGFVVNRILVPMINEAVGILADGISSAEDIDLAMKLGANHPMGPLALGDLIGLDICLSVMDVLYYEYGDTKYRAHPLLRKMVRGNRLGRKTGDGFFNYK
jgi:3-hydroxybutyryl-CoA dehydrogenase